MQTARAHDFSDFAAAVAVRRLWNGLLSVAEIFRASADIASAWRSGHAADPRSLAVIGISPQAEADILRHGPLGAGD